MQFIAISGRQQSISLAELEAIFGAPNISVLSQQAIGISSTKSIAGTGNRLGGCLKLTEIIASIPLERLNNVQNNLEKLILTAVEGIPEGKITLGISSYGTTLSPGRIGAISLSLKKTLRHNGRSVRIVPNKSAELSTAAILHNKLVGDKGIELNLIASPSTKTLHITKTIFIQDIDAYAARDQSRPMRDAKVGMLPPKLAQIIINLATAENSVNPSTTVLDPFCGTGVVLQEALLMGYSAYGTDIEQRMIDFSTKNLQWLNSTVPYRLECGDATRHQWQKSFTCIAGETYLGRPLSSLPDRQTLYKIMSDCDTIHRKFLQNVANQTASGFRLCIAVPAWKVQNGFLHLKTLDSLEELGYNRVRFVHAETVDLIYHREDQLVGRELVVLERK